MLAALFVAGEPPPDFAIDWEVIEGRLAARWPVVRSVAHDPGDNFVTITVTDGIEETDAAREACATIAPVIHEAGSRALFAVYTEGGHIVASWTRCPLSTPPEE